MKLSLSWLIGCLSLVSVACYADDPDATAQKGKAIAYTCHGCHGIENYKNTYPTYTVPKLGGQHRDYINDALKEYASGDRAHSTMHAHAASLSVEDRSAIAAFLQGPPPREPGTPSGTPPNSTVVCVSCHGKDGVSTTAIKPVAPILAGQHRDYLEQALRDYKSGKRKNAIMAGMVTQLKDDDIRAIAEFFAKQTSPLCATDKIRENGKCD